MSNVDLDVKEGWVRMYHPGLPGPDGRVPTAVVTRESFEDSHSEKGFELVGDQQTKVVDGTTYVVPSSVRGQSPVGSPKVDTKGGDV